mgnify:FL=1
MLVHPIFLILSSGLIGYYFNQALLGFLAAGTLLNIWYLYKVIDIAGIIERSNLSLTKDTIWNHLTKIVKKQAKLVGIDGPQSKASRSVGRKLLKEIEKSFDMTMDGFCLLDKNNSLIWFNQAASDWLMLSEDDFQTPINHFIDTPAFWNFLKVDDYQNRLEVKAPNDKDIYLSCQLVPFGKNERWIIFRDVSQPVRLAKVRNDFTANASHELRSPLTVISGYIEVMNEDSSINEEWKKPVEEINRQTIRMQRILSDLLLLSQLEAETDRMDDRVIDLQAIVLSVKKDIMSRKNPPERFEVNFSHSGLISGDEFRLQSVVNNLIENADRYSDIGDCICVNWVIDNEGGHLSVIDNGVGIEAKHIDRITERFYRVDKGRSRKAGGTGLGLSIVKNALQNHNATLEIKSELGNGSEFICHFPKERIVA